MPTAAQGFPNGITLGSLSFLGTSGTTLTTLSGGLLVFDSSAEGGASLRVSGFNRTVISSTISLNSDLTVSIDSPGVTFTSSLTLSGNIFGNGNDITVSAAPTSVVTISGAISDGSAPGTTLTKSGDSQLILTNSNNTFSGLLSVGQGSLIVNLNAVANAGLVLGALSADNNYLGTGDIFVANNVTALNINASGTTAGKYVALDGSSLIIENGGRVNITESSTGANFVFQLNSGTFSGGDPTKAYNPGALVLNGVDLAYNANGSGGSEFLNSPNIILNTDQNAIAMSVSLYETGMKLGLNTVTKTGNNALTFTDDNANPGVGGGIFRAAQLVVASGLGIITLNQSQLDLSGTGLIFTGTNALFVTQTMGLNPNATNMGRVNLGMTNQLTPATALTLGSATGTASVITNIFLNGNDQTFSQINLGANARLGLWFDRAPATPVTLTLNNLAITNATTTATSSGIDYLSIYNWLGNPATHLDDGTLGASNNNVKYTGSVDLTKVWFRGYDPGAQLDTNTGNLVPVDFLHTTDVSTLWGGNWFDFANWTVDIPNSPGAVVTFAPATANATSVSLQG